MGPAEHPWWAQMFLSAIKPEISTGGIWEKEEHQLEKTKTNQPENQTQAVAQSQAKKASLAECSGDPVPCIMHDSTVTPENAV